MTNRPHFVSVPSAGTVNETGNNTETVMATLPGVIPEVASQTIKLSFTGVLQLGASSTGGTFRARRVNLAGTVVGIPLVVTNVAVAAGVGDVAGGWEDTPGEGVFTYVLTYQGTGDTGVGGLLQSEFTARWD